MNDPSRAEDDEAFPRHATAELVGREIELRERRERWQAPLVALGSVFLALAFPTEALLGETLDRVEATARGEGLGLHLLPCALARACVALFDLDPEAAWFAVAALAFGASVLPLAAIARERGWERGPALGTALVALAAPVALVAATLPDASSARLLGAAILGAELARSRSTATRRACAWFLATALHLSNAWAWPALLAAQWSARRADRADPAEPAERAGVAGPASFLPAFAALAAFGGVFFGLHAAAGEVPGALARAGEHLLAGGSTPERAGLAGWALAFAGLGAAGVGAIVLVVRSAHAGIWRRELGLLVFGLTPVVLQVATGSSTRELPWLGLVPLGLLGLLDLLQLADERRRGALARLAAVPLVAFGVLGAARLRADDPHGEWRGRASAALEPGDVVLSASREHLYLLARRFRLETVDLDALARLSADVRARAWDTLVSRAGVLRSEGRRLVLDVPEPGIVGERARALEEELEHFVARAAPLRLPVESEAAPARR